MVVVVVVVVVTKLHVFNLLNLLNLLNWNQMLIWMIHSLDQFHQQLHQLQLHHLLPFVLHHLTYLDHN